MKVGYLSIWQKRGFCYIAEMWGFFNMANSGVIVNIAEKWGYWQYA
jgi:hypothetical protein